MHFPSFFLKKKCPIYKNDNISIINLNTNRTIETGICRSNEMRKKTDVFFCPITKLLTKTEELITKPSNKLSCLFYDEESVVKFNDVVIFSLACGPCNDSFNSKQNLEIKWVLIDKTHCLLLIFEQYDDLANYVRGDNYKYFYKIYLNEFHNIGYHSIRRGKNETYINVKKKHRFVNPISGCIETYNPLELHQLKIFCNNHHDVYEYNKERKLSDLVVHFNQNVKINRIYKFASVHENKMQIFKETVEEVVGFKIMY